MKKASYFLAATLVCAASLLMFAPLPPARAQNVDLNYDFYVGTIGSVAYTITGGPPGATVIYNITASNPGVLGYSRTQLDPSGPWADSLSVPITLDASGGGRLAYYVYGKTKGATDQTTCSPQVRCFTPLHYTVTPPATAVAKLQYLKDGAYVDVPATLNVLKGDTLTFKAFPSPADSRFYPFDPLWGGTSGATGQGVDNATVTFNTLSKTTKDFKTVTATIQNGGPTMTANVIVADGVKSVGFEPVDAASLIDANPNTGSGRRVFPDKNSPGDAVNRRKVRVKAATSFGAGQTIYFKSFDLDDPSSDAAPVDPNGAAGGDNRGGGAGTAQQSGLLSPAGGSGTTSSATATTDAAGFASVELTVTMQPGDNFMVAASHDSKYLPGVTVSGTTLKDSAGLTVGAATMKAKASPMLTVWRRVHVEVDSMGAAAGNSLSGSVTAVAVDAAAGTMAFTVDRALEVNRFENGAINVAGTAYFVLSNTANVVNVAGTTAPPVGSAFNIVDDDDFNGNDPIPRGDDGEDIVEFTSTLALMQDSDNPDANIFAAAYVKPECDWARNQGYNQSGIAFSPNIVTGGAAAQIALGRNSGGDERDDFWVIYVQVGYQQDPVRDKDPDGEDAVTGVTPAYATADSTTNSAGVPRGGDGTIIFQETSRDADQADARGDENRRATAPHEVGHQFGLRGDAPGFHIMHAYEPLDFVPDHLNVIRWRIKSPGQP